MRKHESDAKLVLKRLGKLAEFLSSLDAGADDADSFQYPLEIIQKTMMFDMSVLYKVSNVIENRLILEVVKTLDPQKLRLDLKEGRKLRLFLDNRDKRYVNEVMSFINKGVSHINVPGMGCDVMGYVYLPESFGGAYLFGGDFCGKESSVKDFEVAGIEVMCHFLSAILMKTQFKQQAEYDHLTGLFNSAKIRLKVQNVLARFQRKPDSTASIALGDIDFFKKINDSYGHIQGDMVLKSVGDLLSGSLRGVFDVAGRYGGEEFLLIFDETDEETAFQITERLRKAIEAHPFEQVDKTGEVMADKCIHITMSFGISMLDRDSEIKSDTDWIARADKALYESKQNGRNRTTLFKGE